MTTKLQLPTDKTETRRIAPTPSPASSGGSPPQRPPVRDRLTLGLSRADVTSKRNTWIPSAALHVLALILVAAYAILMPEREEKIPTEVVFYSAEEAPPPPPPIMEKPKPEPKPEPPKPKPEPEPEPPVEIAKVEPPPTLPPKAEPVVIPPRVERKIERPKPAPPKPAPPKPKPVVKTNVFAPDTPVVAKSDAPARRTMTGAFNEKKAKTKEVRDKREIEVSGFAAVASNASRQKSSGPKVVSAVTFNDENAAPSNAKPSRQARVVTAGFTESGNEAVGDAEPSRPYREVVATNFAETKKNDVRSNRTDREVTDVAINGDVRQAPSRDRGSVNQGGFADGDAGIAKGSKKSLPQEKLESPVEILSKLNPRYTDEARRLKIEGEVVLRVTFNANGQLVIHGVLGSLGHGLDEAAIKAAESIKFKPARRGGRAVDHTAKLRVVFQLA